MPVTPKQPRVPAMPRLPPNQKCMVVELFQDVFLQTDGTTTAKEFDLDCSEFEDLAPYVEGMFVLTNTVNRTSDFQWAIYVSWTNTGRTWSQPVALHTAITANGESIQSVYSTTTNFAGRKMKVVAGAKNGSAGSRETASCSAWLVLLFRT